MKNILFALLFLSGCTTASQHSAQLHPTQGERITVGKVQSQIKKGMSQAEVASVLGSPNIVSRNETGNESWIYDKIATESSYSNSTGGYGGILGVGAPIGSVLLGGVGAGSVQESAGAAATTERTLTVIIAFDQTGRVQNSSYHSSHF